MRILKFIKNKISFHKNLRRFLDEKYYCPFDYKHTNPKNKNHVKNRRVKTYLT